VDAFRAKYRWYRTPPMRDFLAGTPVIVQGDDHEVTDNYSGEDVDQGLRARGLKAFHEYWPVRASRRGRLYHSVRHGRNVELFVLDERNHRSASALESCEHADGDREWVPFGSDAFRAAYAPLVPSLGLPVPAGCRERMLDPSRTFLGEAQERWLLDGLARSTATWKLVISELPIQSYLLNPYDRWEGYPVARERLLRGIVARGVRNVAWLSADTHATMAKDVTFMDGSPTGMKEVVTGPIGAVTYAKQLELIAGEGVGAQLGPLLQSMGATCAAVDTFSYAVVTASRTSLTVDSRDRRRRSVCGGPALTLQAG
jgi:phosphodiesterase/alkaline phosphatase D-like protein